MRSPSAAITPARRIPASSAVRAPARRGRGRLRWYPYPRAANTYTGATSILAGTLQLAVNNALPTATALTVWGTLNLNGYNQTVASLSGTSASTVALGTGALTVGDSTTTTFSGTISATGSGAGLTKVGAGTLVLTGADHDGYAHTFTINGGTLQLGVSNFVPATAAVTLANVAGANVEPKRLRPDNHLALRRWPRGR